MKLIDKLKRDFKDIQDQQRVADKLLAKVVFENDPRLSILTEINSRIECMLRIERDLRLLWVAVFVLSMAIIYLVLK